MDEDDKHQKEQHAQSFAKQMLQSRLFIGNFQEKRYVESLQTYRDVIVIANEETDLTRDVKVVKNRVRGFYGHDYWIGITGPDMIGAPAGNCLWVELSDEIFGSYWYKISKIKFRPNEMLLRLKAIRPVGSSATATDILPSLKKTPHQPRGDGENKTVDDTSVQRTLNEACIAAKTAVLYYLYLFCSSILTVQNTKELVKFLSVMLAALFTGLVHSVEYLGGFTIKFMRETSVLIKSITPIIIAFINLIGKIIGGFYLLILSMWRDRKGPPPVYQSPYINRLNPMITNGNAVYSYNTVYFRRPLPAPPTNNYRSSVRITPLD